MLKTLHHFFRKKLLRKNFSYTIYEKQGELKLFDKPFFYHYGLAFKNTYDEVFVRGIYNFKQKNETPLIIDCGANMGLSILFFSKTYPNSRIIAFEPDRVVLPYLKKNIKSQQLTNVELHEKAIWIKNEKLKFFTDHGLGGRIGVEYRNQKPIEVEALRLKDFLDYEVDMLKIDIEGAEYEVLKDCKGHLGKVKNIFVEYHSTIREEQHLEDILNILKNAGFRYHLKESFSRSKPFVDKKIVCQKFDMAINIFGYRDYE